MIVELGLGRFGMFGVTWTVFLVAAILSFAFQVYRQGQRVSVAAFVKHAIPASGWLTRSAGTDVLMYVISKFIGGVFVAANFALSVGLATIVAACLHDVHKYTPANEITYVTIIIWSLVLFLIADFSNYITHMLQHFVPVLWELHKVHHSATFLNPLTTKRMHPLGDQFDNVVAAIFVGVGFGICKHFTSLSIAEMAILIANANMIGTILVLDSLRHSHFPVSFGVMDRLILSPHMHQIHHSYRREHWDLNFGNKLSIWDRAFGTLYTPRAGEQATLGLDKGESDEFHSLWGAYLGPLIKIGRLLRGRPSYIQRGHAPPAPKPFFERLIWRKPAVRPDKVAELAEQAS